MYTPFVQLSSFTHRNNDLFFPAFDNCRLVVGLFPLLTGINCDRCVSQTVDA
jgi:hypothetical protein